MITTLTYAERLILNAATKVCNDVCRRAYVPGSDDANLDIPATFGLAEAELLEAINTIDEANLEIPFDAVVANAPHPF